MSFVRVRVSSLLRILVFTAAICIGRGFILRGQTPQTPQQMRAQDALNQGVQAYKSGQTEQAIQQFEHAKELDPNLANARLYLATAYASQYIPGAPSDENKHNAQRAIEEFRAVLQTDAENLSAIDGIGSLLFNMAGTPPVDTALFQKSKSFHEKHIQIKPQDPEPYYWIGVIDWTLPFRADRELRARHNDSNTTQKLSDGDPLPAFLQAGYAAEWEPTIDEGIANLKKALELKPDYADAMLYLNQLYRRKADTVSDREERDQYIEMADELIEKVKDIKQRVQQQTPEP